MVYDQSPRMAELHETEPIQAEWLAVFDVDRTVFDTNSFNDALAEVAEDFGLSRDTIGKAMIESGDTSFQQGDFILDLLGSRQDKFVQEFHARHKSDTSFLYDDAVYMFDWLEGRGIPIVLYTRGTRTNQRLKLASNNRLQTYPFKITDDPYKGYGFGGMYTDGRYRFDSDDPTHAPIVARSLFFFEDNAEGFIGIPAAANIISFYLPERSRLGRRGHLDTTPVDIGSLYEALPYVEQVLGSL